MDSTRTRDGTVAHACYTTLGPKLGSPNTYQKKKVWRQHIACNENIGGHLGACWPNSLAKSVNSMFNQRLYLTKVEVIGEGTCGKPLPHHTHMHISIHIPAQRCTYIYPQIDNTIVTHRSGTRIKRLNVKTLKQGLYMN